MFHVFGDSHATTEFSCWGAVEAKTHYLGPMLCYTFGNSPIPINDPKYGVNNGDIVCFCFGEIDCRCHVHKYISPTRSYTDVIDEIVDRYFVTIQRLRSLFNDLTVCVFNVPPPIRYIPTNHNWPYLGTDDERKAYHEYFNQKLKEKCIEYDMIFFDVYDKYQQDGFLAREYSDGCCHIIDGRYVKEFFDEHFK